MGIICLSLKYISDPLLGDKDTLTKVTMRGPILRHLEILCMFYISVDMLSCQLRRSCLLHAHTHCLGKICHISSTRLCRERRRFLQRCVHIVCTYYEYALSLIFLAQFAFVPRYVCNKYVPRNTPTASAISY